MLDYNHRPGIAERVNTAIDAALIAELIENATWAPNHGLTEPWKFHVFQGEARHSLIASMQQTYREVTPAATIASSVISDLASSLPASTSFWTMPRLTIA